MTPKEGASRSNLFSMNATRERVVKGLEKDIKSSSAMNILTLDLDFEKVIRSERDPDESYQ